MKALITQSCPHCLWPHGLQPNRLLWPWKFFRQEHYTGLPFPSPGDLPHLGVNPGLLQCRQILYCLIHEESLFICILAYICIYVLICKYIYIHTHTSIYTYMYIHLSICHTNYTLCTIVYILITTQDKYMHTLIVYISVKMCVSFH